MSYSSQTKEELCRFEPDSVCCLLAELSGIVCAAGSVIYRGGGDKRLSIETENNAVARRAFRLLREVFDVQPQLVTLKRSRLGGRSAYRIEISGSEASFVLEGCGIEMGQRRGVPREITVRKCCRMSFLRGVFLACGSVTDPEKEYHLEFVLEDEAFAAAEPDYSVITDDEAQDVLMLISHFPQVVRKAMEQSEPSMITRHTTQLAQAYNKYYFEHRIMDESDPAGTAARVNLTRAVRDVIKTGLYLIGVEAPERM